MVISWCKQIIFTTEDIKNTNPIPNLVQNLISMLPINIISSEISIILTELYNNAVDHGLLKLNSDVKQRNNGLEKYYKMRQKKLKQLQTGFVKFNFEYISISQILNIEISDSGQGFDCNKYLQQPFVLFNKAGRGLYIISKMVANLYYNHEDNILKLEYRIKKYEQLGSNYRICGDSQLNNNTKFLNKGRR
jgi:anti-sigma regulatory factor (Ser/Thr protein kinase)